MGINCTHWMFGRGTHGGCEYKCVYECVSMCVCVHRGNRWQEKIALSKRGGGWSKLGGGGGADRVMVLIPGKETLERCRGSL